MTAADDYDDLWAGVDATPALSSINPFDPSADPEEHAAWDKLAEEDRQAAVPPGRRLIATTANTLTMKAPRWLYDWRIPMNGITLLAGREGIGKSTISYDLTARVTRGRLDGRHYGTPKDVAVVASEDSWEHVIVPRLVAAGADLTRVHRIEATDGDGRADAVSVPADLGRLGVLCVEKDVVLVILDPLMSVIHGSLDTHKDREVRQALDPLARFSINVGVAVLGLIHVNKTSTTDPLTSVMASRAFAAVARSVLYCMLDPDADRDDRYLLGHPKSSLGPPQVTLRYHIIGVKLDIADEEEPVIVTSRVVWDGTDDRSVRDAMEAAGNGQRVGQLATDLEEWIIQQGRTVTTAEVVNEFSDTKRNTVEAALGRMVERGTLYRPIRGHYAIKHRADASDGSDVRNLTGKPDGQTDGSGGDTSVSVVSEESVLLMDLTDLTSDRGTRARQEPDPLPGWAGDAYDRET